MQSILLILSWLLIWGPPSAIAYGPRGAMERIFYYYCYLSEEISVTDGNYQVGVGCAGSRTGGRCNFNEFIEYIWSAKTDGGVTNTVRPTGVNVIAGNADFTKQNIVNLRQVVDEFRYQTDQRITWNIDPDRVLSGATTYQEALAGIGNRLGALDETVSDAAQTIKTNGQNSVKLLYDMRFSQFERQRRRYILQKMGMTAGELKTTPGRNTLGGAPRVQLIDAAATLDARGGEGNFANEFHSYMDQAKSVDDNAREHWAAITAADSAQLGAGCT
ncbi:MAG: hypothetical protein M1822_008891 [Bathelium mastoideum]|nr:MAG: hypothetical protein M1822_008891 [Bathelium mastoideum]